MTSEAAGWMAGIGEALGVLMARGPGSRERAAGFAVSALAWWADPADWTRAGLPAAGAPERGTARWEIPLPVSHPAVLRLAHAAMSLRVSVLATGARPRHWDRLAAFFRPRVPSGDLGLRRIVENGLLARVAAGETSGDVLDGLAKALEQHRAADGEDGYATGVARMNLALAWQAGSAVSDLGRALALVAAETARRAVRYRPAHPVTVEARGHLTDLLLASAEAEPQLCARRDLAGQALAEARLSRIAWDRLFGVTSAGAIRSRVQAGHALLLLGELDQARVCLECALAFDTRSSGTRDDQTLGTTFSLLARTYAASGDRQHARNAERRALQIRSGSTGTPG